MISAKLIQSDDNSNVKLMVGAHAVFQAVCEMKETARSEGRSLAGQFLRRARTKFLKWRTAQIKSLATYFELATAQEAERAYCNMLSSANRDVFELAVKIAKDFVAASVAKDSDYLAARVSQLIQQQHSAQLKVLINPEQIGAFQHSCQASGLILESAADDSVAVGEAVIVTLSGELRINWLDHFEQLASEYRDHLQVVLKEKFAC